jgi:hypothetical protein
VALVYDNNIKVKLKAIEFFIFNFNQFPEVKKKVFAETVIADIVTNSQSQIKELVSFNTLNILRNLDQ